MKINSKILIVPALLSLTLLTQARDYHHDDHRDYHHGYHSGPGIGLSFAAGAIFGGIVATLPHEHTTVVVHDTPYYYSEGVYYRSCNRGYVIMPPPPGVVIDTLPPDYSLVWISGRPYYYSRGVYYLQQPTGYVVANAPQNVVVTSAAPPPPPVVETYSAPQASSAPLPNPESAPVSKSFYKRGHDWGMDLRNDVASMDEFVDYLKSNVPNSSSPEYQDFRKGFISGYGQHAENAIDKAYKSAKK
ncbi:MAG: DUF6515 family protein [Verrucomicrobiota bacterium]